MALNPNHTFEELDGVKCSVVEKNCSPERVAFLEALLKLNGYVVVVAKSPPPKTPAKPAAAPVEETEPAPPSPETFTVGVTDLSFNPVSAVYNRELRTAENAIVDIFYWRQLAHETSEMGWYWSN